MWQICLLALVATATAQIPSLGWCPDFQPMASFNMNRFLGAWFEAERLFTVSEVGSRCVTTNYLSTPEGRIVVSNEITNALTGMKRVMEGSLQLVGREGEGRLMIKYSSLPLPYETEYSILDTDYDNYAVMWSCSGIGPVHTQNTWLLTRERLPSLSIMQLAYAVLDRYKISRTFFVKTNQADCNILPDPAAVPPIERSNVQVVEKSAVVKDEVVEKVVVEPALKDVVQERTANPEPEEPSKPMQVPELIMSESEKKEEKLNKPEDMPAMPMKENMPEKPIKEMSDKPMMELSDKPMKEMPDKPMKEMAEKPMNDMPAKPKLLEETETVQ